MESYQEDHLSHKPEKSAYVTYSLIKSLLASLLFFALFYLALRCLPHAPKLPILGGLGGIILLHLLARWAILPIQYAKESYTILDDRLIAKGGSIFSSYEQELLIRNITHISLNLPYLEHKLYGTGYLHIQAAGGSEVEVHMRSIAAPEAMYKELLKLLEKNGFSVSCKVEVESERPDPRGVWLSTLGAALIAGVFVLWIFGAIIGASKDPKMHETLQLGWEFNLIFSLVGFFALLGVIYQHGRAMRREYRMFEDAITSKTDFFGVDQTIIPMKNLSDSALNQGLIGRFLGIHHVSMSCQGSGHEVVFQHVAHGERWKSALDILLKSLAVNKAANKAIQRKEAEQSPGFAKKPVFEAERDESFEASFKMDKRFLFIPALVMFGISIALAAAGVGLLLAIKGSFQDSQTPPPLAIVAFIFIGMAVIALMLSVLRGIGGWVTYAANSFRINATGFEQDFQFIVKRKVVFNADKVTGMLVKQGIFDRMLGTASIEFWSIGASDHLRFRHIRLDDELLSQIKAKIALHPKTQSIAIPTEASLEDTLKSNFFFYLLLLLAAPVLATFSKLALIGIAVLFVLPFVFTNIYYRFHHLELYDDSLLFRKGILFRTSYYIRYEDIKYISSTRYPMSQTGTITFDVAGERVIKTDNGEQKISNRFHVRYIPDIDYHHLAIDMLLGQKIELEKMPTIKGSEDNYTPAVIQTSAPHKLQKLLLPASFLLFFVASSVGSVIFALQGGGLTAPEIEKFKAIPGIPFVLAWGLPIAIVLSLVVLTCLVLYVRSFRYIIDQQKVSKRWGLFFQQHMGIHFVDIDYIGKQQGAVDKLFSTGKITVNTVGSSATDMTLDAMPDADAFYQTLKQHYRPNESE